MKNYSIWIGYYHLGQGFTPPDKPEKVTVIQASSFRAACFLYELQNTIENLQKRMNLGDNYIEDIHFGHLDYNPATNSNPWTGKYYESEKEAWTSFGKHERAKTN